MDQARTYVDHLGSRWLYDGQSPLSWRVSAHAVAIRDGAILLVEPVWAPRWELPGGGVELARQETLVEGARRECWEETGYRFTPDEEPQFITESFFIADGRPLDTLAEDEKIFPISSQTLYENIRRYGRTIGIERLTVHALRHTAAKLRRRAGASLEEVQAVLGHATVTTTARYLAQLEGTRDSGWRAAAELLEGEHPHG